MGSEQSQHQAAQISAVNAITCSNQRPALADASRLQRGYTIADSTNDSLNSSPLVDKSPPPLDSRPVSPPMSVCSDSDLPPYISYTNKPIGDSPKLRNKGQKINKVRPAVNLRRQSTSPGVTKRITSASSTLIVVNKGTLSKEVAIEKDPDILRLQSIPMFLPVMRGTLSLPAMRDPEVLERLQPNHVLNMCTRLQCHYNLSATKIAQDQNVINTKIKEVDQDIAKLLVKMTERQKQCATYAEAFSRVRQISQQLSRCNTLLNQNIELMESLNNELDVDERLEPFVWTTN
ncbi:CLUMA_CG006001, isoform A [Clunio marinus]|uniref:BLOC-1-related complex subunit 5 n=1 Tax=Clunio marinus TaxID=568069 RepID=A0A1J1HY01_9DIPT|nr:CLUMA_CG006001, isoform A [Clunio marinus]